MLELMEAEILNLSLTVAIYARHVAPSLVHIVKSIRSNPEAANVAFIIVCDGKPVDDETLKGLAELNVEVVQLPGYNSQIQKVIKIRELCKTDVVLLTQDDLEFAPDTVGKIMAKMRDPKVNMVCTKITPRLTGGFVESILNMGNLVSRYIAEKWNRSNYLQANRIMAFRMDAFRKFRAPLNVISMDAFFYLENKRLGGEFEYVSDATIFSRLAKKISEYRKQSTRFLNSADEMKQFFDARFIDTEYEVPRSLYIRGSLRTFLRHPFLFTCYMLVQLYVRVRKDTKAMTQLWDVDVTTKLSSGK
jgi:hypothetical protein